MSTVVEKLAAAGYLDGDSVERVGKTVHEFMKLAQEDPEFHKEVLVKLSSSWLAPAQSAMGALAVGMGVSLAGKAAGDVYGAIKSSITKARDYKGMLDANPDLGGKRDAKQVQKAFNTLHKFNPGYASDSSVAGQWVRDSMEMERVDLNQVNALTMAHKNIQQSDSSVDPIQAAGNYQSFGRSFFPSSSSSKG